MGTCKTSVSFIYLGVLMFLFFQVSDVSSATDTISTDQPLSGTRTLISSNDTFEFGRFHQDLDQGNGEYIGIWYKQFSPRIIVWVADREQPFYLEPSEHVFMISNGNLVFRGDDEFNETVWSTGVKSSRSKDVRAVLLDNGNLVLRDGSTSSATVLWQSFDHPTDTWLPGVKLKLGSQLLTSWNTLTDGSLGRYTLKVDPITNNSLIIVWNGSMPYWSSGPWDDRLKYFKGLPDWGAKLSFELNLDESYITYSIPMDYGYGYHLFMDVSGRLMWRYFNPRLSQGLTVIWSQPENVCAVYNYCGSFGICDVTENQPCRCVPGFRRANDEYDSNYLSGGCIRETELVCGKGNISFLPIGNMKLATDPTTLVLTSNLSTRCFSACLANCSCNAYAYDDNKCLMWTKVAFSLQQLEFGNEGHTFFLRVAPSNITTPQSPPINQGKTKLSKSRSVVLPVVLSSALVTLLAALSVGFYCCFSIRRKKRAQTDEIRSRDVLGGGISNDDDGENRCYLNLHDIMVATNAFSEENKLGEGGFGPVYKGKLLSGIDVAIKRLSKKSSQGLTEFKNEVVLIIKLQHKNLVRLLGYCVEGDEKLLIYEYLSNKSLDVLLFDSEKGRELDWETRMKILNGTTRGLQYLHEDSRLRIIHRDLKASNILLDDEMNPKISDFGTARIFGCKQIDDSTQRIVGTFGYMSPEYALGGIISEKSDIYSFGVLLLEIISGKKATRFIHNDQKHSLVSFAWESWCETKGVNIVDEALCGSYSVKEVMRCVHIALLCVQDHPNDRPTISQIVYMLSNDNTLPIPKQPTFSNVLNGNQQLVSSDCVFSINEVTQTELEAR